jgi:hypothetical protein
MAKSIAIEDDDILHFYRNSSKKSKPNVSQPTMIDNDDDGDYNSNDDEVDDQEKQQQTAQRRQPEVIRFHDPTAQMNRASATKRTGFLSASVHKIHSSSSSPSSTSSSSNVSTADAQLDNEITQLLQTGQLAKDIERFNASQLEGRDRRRNINHQLTRLGLPQASGQATGNRQKKARVPLTIAKGMLEKSRGRAQKLFAERQEAGDDLVVSTATDRRYLVKAGGKRAVVGAIKRGDLVMSSAEHPLKHTVERQLIREREQSKRVRWDQRGLRPAVGRFKKGCLHIRSHELGAGDGNAASGEMGDKNRSKKRKRPFGSSSSSKKKRR